MDVTGVLPGGFPPPDAHAAGARASSIGAAPGAAAFLFMLDRPMRRG